MPRFPVTIFNSILIHAFSLSEASLIDVARRKKTSSDVYYATSTADKFASFSYSRKQALNTFHQAEQVRLQDAIMRANTEEDKDLLAMVATQNEEHRLEAQNALNEMINFAMSLKQSMGEIGTAASCRDLTCGANAYCTDYSTSRAHCSCQAGYEGNGFVCNPPTTFHPTALLESPVNAHLPQVADVDITSLKDKTVAVVFRDARQMQHGYLMMGKPGPEGVAWTAPVAISNGSQAFGLKIVELNNDTADQGSLLAIAFRDQDRGGVGMLVSAYRDALTGDITVGAPKPYAKNQAQGISMVPLPGQRVAVLFSDHQTNGIVGRLSGGAMRGMAALLRISDGQSPPELVSKHRFAAGAVSRISATKLAPDQFLLAYRQGEHDQNPAIKAEASCMFAQLRADELIFDPHPVSLEPAQTQIWARSLALVQDGVVAYTYHSGNEQATKEAILRIDPETRKLTLLRKPQVVGTGFTPFVGMLSNALVSQDGGRPTLLQEKGPRLFSYHSQGGNGKVLARICKVDGSGLPERCAEMDWFKETPSSIEGVPLGDGRLLFISTDAHGTPFYQLVGLLEADP